MTAWGPLGAGVLTGKYQDADTTAGAEAPASSDQACGAAAC